VIGEPVWMKEKHVRFQVGKAPIPLRLKAWNFVERAAELAPGARIDVVFELEEDAYSLARGYAGWSATLRDLARCALNDYCCVAMPDPTVRSVKANSTPFAPPDPAPGVHHHEADFPALSAAVNQGSRSGAIAAHRVDSRKLPGRQWRLFGQ
jgi:hypothetical protein